MSDINVQGRLDMQYLVYKGIHKKEKICMYLINFSSDNLKPCIYNKTKLDININEATKDKGDIKILSIIWDCINI